MNKSQTQEGTKIYMVELNYVDIVCVFFLCVLFGHQCVFVRGDWSHGMLRLLVEIPFPTPK